MENPEITPKKGSGHDVKQHIPKKNEKGVPQRVDFDDIDTEGVQKPENPTYRRMSPFGIHFKLPLETRLATILLLRVFFWTNFETLPNWKRIQKRATPIFGRITFRARGSLGWTNQKKQFNNKAPTEDLTRPGPLARRIYTNHSKILNLPG